MTRRRYVSRATTRNDSLAVAVTRRVGNRADCRLDGVKRDENCVVSNTFSRRPSHSRCVAAMMGSSRGKTRLIVLLIPPKKHVRPGRQSSKRLGAIVAAHQHGKSGARASACANHDLPG